MQNDVFAWWLHMIFMLIRDDGIYSYQNECQTLTHTYDLFVFIMIYTVKWSASSRLLFIRSSIIECVEYVNQCESTVKSGDVRAICTSY